MTHTNTHIRGYADLPRHLQRLLDDSIMPGIQRDPVWHQDGPVTAVLVDNQTHARTGLKRTRVMPRASYAEAVQAVRSVADALECRGHPFDAMTVPFTTLLMWVFERYGHDVFFVTPDDAPPPKPVQPAQVITFHEWSQHSGVLTVTARNSSVVTMVSQHRLRVFKYAEEAAQLHDVSHLQHPVEVDRFIWSVCSAGDGSDGTFIVPGLYTQITNGYLVSTKPWEDSHIIVL